MRGLAFLALLGATVATAQPSVDATPSKNEVTVGETFFVDVTAHGPDGTAWTFPAHIGSERLELRLVDDDPAAPLPANTRRYSGYAFALDDVVVPAIEVDYRLPDGTSGNVETEPVPLRIASLLPKDEDEQKLADIDGPTPLTIGTAFWIALGVSIAALVAVAAWLYRRLRPKPASAVAPPPVPADAEARAALDALARDDLPGAGDYRGFYIRLAQIAKRYLERRLRAPVLEMTTTEAVAYLRDHERGRLVAPTLRELAQAADQVKFARGDARRSEAERHLSGTRALVDQLEAAFAPPPEASAPVRGAA